jgi:dihydroorotase
MENILIKQAEIVAPQSEWHGKRVNVLIENGKIQKIGSKQYEATKIIEGKDLKLTPGWCDLRAFTGDPGFESKEDMESFAAAAAIGGYTAVACMPNTQPSLDNKENIHYIKSRSKKFLTQILPVGSLTVKNKGEELTEILDMHHNGAIAFSDGNAAVWYLDVMLRGLLYLKPFNGLLMVHAEDRYLTTQGQMNESITSTSLGLKGIPKLAEEVMVQRDISILEYTAGKIHFSHVSSPRSLEMIKEAKKKGLQVTCDIAVYQLVLEESLMTTFDTNLKVNPPLRSKKDIDLYWKYLLDGTIDAIISDHQPQDIECKNLEFDLAEFGISNIETAFSVIHSTTHKLSFTDLVNKFSIQPRVILNLPIPEIKEGALADLTLFDADETWTPTAKTLKSKSKNNPFIGTALKGKVKAVFNDTKYQLF